MTLETSPSVSNDTSPRLVLATGHSNDVLYAALLPNGSTIASLGDDRSLILWNAQTGEMLCKYDYPGPKHWWHGLSPNGLYAFAHTETQSLVLDTLTGETKIAFEWGAIIAISHDGRYVAHDERLGNNGQIEILDMQGWKRVACLRYSAEHGLSCMAFSPDGRLLAVAPSCEGSVQLHDLVTGTSIRDLRVTAERLRLENHDLDCVCADELAFSPDGAMLATISAASPSAIWDTQTGEVLAVLPEFECLVFTEDGTTLLSGDHEGWITYRDTETWDAQSTHRAHDGWVRTVQVSASGEFYLTAGNDRAVRLWDAKTGELLMSMGGYDYSVLEVAFAPNGLHLLSTNSDGTVRLWDTRTCTLTDTQTAPSGRADWLAVSCDGLLAAKGDGCEDDSCWLPTAVALCRTDNENILHVFREVDREGVTDEPISAAFSPDGRTLAVGHLGFVVSLWDVRTGRLIGRIRTSRDSVCSTAFSPDGGTLAVGTSYDDAVELFGVRTLKRRRRLLEHTNNVDSLAFSPDGRILATGSSDGTIKLWNPRNGRLIATLVIFPSADGGSNEWLAYTPDGFYTGSRHAEEFIRWQVDGVLDPGNMYAERFRRKYLL